MSELRQYPRVLTSLPVEIRNYRGEQCTTVIRNISPGGIMVDGDVDTRAVIDGNADEFFQKPVELEISCQFPEMPVPFRGHCRLVFVRRLSQKSFNFGMRFFNLPPDMAQMLNHYLQDLGSGH